MLIAGGVVIKSLDRSVRPARRTGIIIVEYGRCVKATRRHLLARCAQARVRQSLFEWGVEEEQRISTTDQGLRLRSVVGSLVYF